MNSYLEQLQQEIVKQRRLNPENFVESKLISARIALKAGISPEIVCTMLKLKPGQIKHLISQN